MSRYMVKVSYSVAGLQGIMKEGAEHRRAFIAKMVAGMGGSLESFDFGFGETDRGVSGRREKNARSYEEFRAALDGSRRRHFLLAPPRWASADGPELSHVRRRTDSTT